MKGDGHMDGTGLESQSSAERIPPQQNGGMFPLTEGVKALLSAQADWQYKVEEVADKVATQCASEIAGLVNPTINKSTLTVVKTFTDELESKLKDILLRKCQ